MRSPTRTFFLVGACTAAWAADPGTGGAPIPAVADSTTPTAVRDFAAMVRQDSAAPKEGGTTVQTRTDSMVPSVAPVPAIHPSDTAKTASTVVAEPRPDSAVAPKGPLVPVVVRSSAPVGSKVTLEGVEARMDSSGRFQAAAMVDSARRASGTVEICLFAGGQNLCTPLHPQGFDTLDIAPLQVKIDSVVETRDTVRTVVDTTRYDSAALRSDAGPKVIQSAAGKTVVVRGKRRPPRMLGQERVTVQTIKRMPALAEPDVMRAVQALPGVVASSDFSTKIYVRGSSSDENLILFDNAVVYSPAHFGGLFSTFLADATGGLDFYKGGFDPKWGNRLASVLLVSSKVGGSDRDTIRDTTSLFRKDLDKGVRAMEGLVQGLPADSEAKVKSQGSARITTFSGSLATDGQQGDVSWALAGRRTWIGSALAAARAIHATDLQLDYDFYDWQGSAAWGHAGDTVRASIYQGRDKLSLDPFSIDWGNLVVPVNVRWRLGDRLTYLGTASYSQFDQTFDFSPIISLYNAIWTWAGRSELRYDAGAGNLVSLGGEYNSFHVNLTRNVQVLSTQNASLTDADLWSGWLQDRWVIDPKNTVTAGVRAYWYPTTDETALDPRISYTWRPVPDWKFDAHWGRYTQYMTSIRFADLEMPNEFWYSDQKPMKPTWQDMTCLGAARDNLGPWNLHASLEGYYKDVHNVPLLFPFATTADSTTGYDYFARNFSWLDGYAMGAEFAVGKDEGWWSGSLSYGYSRSVLRQQPYTNGNGTDTFPAYRADWDQAHTFKANGAINWSGRKGDEALWVSHMRVGDYFRSSFQLTAYTGHPYTPYLGVEQTQLPFSDLYGRNGAEQGAPETSQNTQGDKNSAEYPPYFRIDLTPIDWGRAGIWRFYFTIINVTGHKNAFLINYTRGNPPEQRTTYQFPRLPIFLGYERQF
jgi:hypothetical protein